MLIPLVNFVCDHCGAIINSPSEGYVEFYKIKDANGSYVYQGFSIVHHAVFSPNHSAGGHCYLHEKRDGNGSLSLKEFVESPDRMTRILAFMDIGEIHDFDFRPYSKVGDVREFVEFVRRVTIPYYEEARFYIQEAFSAGDLGDPNEIATYSQDVLKFVVERYSEY